MRVLYEGAIFQMLRCGGVSRCFSEIIQRLPFDIDPIVVGPMDQPDSLNQPHVDYQGVQTEPSISWLRKWTRERMQRQVVDRFGALDADLEHWTYYNGLCRRPIQKSHRPLIVTVLDFVHEAFPSLDRTGRHIAIKNQAIQAADHLICISKSTHRELCQRFPSARAKASVIPLGTSLADVAPASLPENLVDQPYVLFVGRRNSYKNFAVVMEAWKRIRNQLPRRCKLVLVGPPMKRGEAAELDWPTDGSAVLVPNAPDPVLRTLYQNARAFVFPSKAEGFGLPSLEAMSAGTPVIVSDLPVMREVVGTCGYYFDPNDPQMLSEMLRSALLDALPGRDAMVAAASERAAKFTWEATAAQTADVYRQVLNRFDLPRSELVTA